MENIVFVGSHKKDTLPRHFVSGRTRIHRILARCSDDLPLAVSPANRSVSNSLLVGMWYQQYLLSFSEPFQIETERLDSWGGAEGRQPAHGEHRRHIAVT